MGDPGRLVSRKWISIRDEAGAEYLNRVIGRNGFWKIDSPERISPLIWDAYSELSDP